VRQALALSEEAREITLSKANRAPDPYRGDHPSRNRFAPERDAGFGSRRDSSQRKQLIHPYHSSKCHCVEHIVMLAHHENPRRNLSYAWRV
jgi:hypothetical protein